MGVFSALGAVFKGLRASLTRTGVHVGETAGYPRIEIHTITESEWLDKGWTKRVSCTVECISEKRMADVLDMNSENLNRMLESSLNLGNEWSVCGVVPGQLQQLTELSDTNGILYRLLQSITVYVERLNDK